MPSSRTTRRRRRRPRSAQRGAVALTLLAAVAVLVLVAALSIPAARLTGLGPWPPQRGDPATSTGVRTTTDVRVGPGLPVDPAAATLDEPAIARAAEAGLRRLRLPPAQPVQASPALPDPGRDAGPAAPEKNLKVLALPERGPDLSSLLGGGSVTLIGHATLLIRSGGFTILSDPDFLQRGEPARFGLGRISARRTDPSMTLEQLPPIDLVVLSRVREDRFDRVVQRQLRRDVPIVVPAASRAELVALGFSSVHGLQPWTSLRIDRPGSGWLQLTATPARPGPALVAAITPPSIGLLLESGPGTGPASHRIWISGDTVVDDRLLTEFEGRLTDLDIALLHLGGARPFGLVKASLDGADAARLAQRLAPRVVLPVPLDDFGDAPAADAVDRILKGPIGGQRTRVRWLARGDVHRLAPSPRWASALDPSLGP